MKRGKKQDVPLIIEEHPDDYNGYPFITLIQYRQEHILTIVDNATEKEIRAFVLDMCSPAGIDEELIITVANEWYLKNKTRFPLSFEFSRRNISHLISPIFKKYPTNHNIETAWHNLYLLYTADYKTESLVEFKLDFPDYPYADIVNKDIELSQKFLFPILEKEKWTI